jgi:dTDP-4-amino-4,6-dideoxygalactose transaminase
MELQPEIDDSVLRVLRSGQYIGGQEVEHFEESFAEYVGAKFCIGVGNGLDALNLSLIAHDIGPGDEVIVPAHTFIATWLAVTRCGASPVPVDTEAGGFNFDLGKVEAAMSSKTKAVIPVHLYGVPVDLTELRRLTSPRGIIIIDDAAQACGSVLDGHRVGASELEADCSAWSFYPGKNLGAFGDAGAVTTSDPEIAKRLRMLGNYGSQRKYQHEILGVNSRLDPVQAAVLNVKLPYLDMWNEERAKIAETYSDELSPVVVTPQVGSDIKTNWHLYVIRTKHRDALRSWLSENSVGTGIHYPTPPALHPPFVESHRQYELAETEEICKEILSLPMGPHLDQRALARVIELTKSFFAQLADESSIMVDNFQG